MRQRCGLAGKLKPTVRIISAAGDTTKQLALLHLGYLPFSVRQSWCRTGRAMVIKQRECAARPFTLPTKLLADSATAEKTTTGRYFDLHSRHG